MLISLDEHFSPAPTPEPDPQEGDFFEGDVRIAGKKIGRAGTTRVPWPKAIIPYRFDCSVGKSYLVLFIFIIYSIIYTITRLLWAFSLVVDRDLLNDTCTDGIKSTSDHVS